MIRTSPSAVSIAVFAAAYFAAPAAFAQLGTATTNPACCSLTTSLANDALRGRDLQGDERFFMTEGAPPNIHFLVDTSGSMRELRHLRNSDHVTFFNSEPSTTDGYTGCTNSYIRADQVGRGWDPTLSYPPTDMGTGLGSDTGFPNLFVETSFYNYMSWGDSSNPTPRSQTTADAVCKNLHPAWETSGPDYAAKDACRRCLTDRGFYKKPNVLLTTNDEWTTKGSNFVFTGKFLNFAPPKYVTLRKVLKEVIRDLRRVRAGYSTFDADNGGKMGRAQNPSCDQIARNASSFDSNRGSYINDINGIGFAGATPLAEALFNIGQYFSSTNNVYTGPTPTYFGFPSSYLKNEYKNAQLTSQSRSWCWGCQTSSVVIITDGQPTADNNLPRAQIEALNGGSTLCPDYNGDLIGDCDTLENALTNDLLDDVAKLLNTRDLQNHTPVIVGDMNTAGMQSLNIYGIGMAVRSPILRNATEGVGGGSYYETDTAAGLKQAIMDIIQNVQTRATAFAAASVSSLQLNRTGGSFLPRFRPARQGTRAAWQGFLYRFDLAQELVLGCVAATAASTTGDQHDLNQDGDCDDIHLIDNVGDAVIEDDQGNFVKLRDTMEPAVPFWEAGDVLKPVATPTQNWMRRNIYTIVDNGGPSGAPDGRLDRYDTPVAFTEANVAVLREYLGISSNPNTCNDLAIALGVGTLTPDDCARVIIRYYRGADALNPDPFWRDYDRTFLLNDIFHSAPIEVEPLADRVFCGFGNQCLPTLFKGNTPLAPSTSGVDGEDAYDDARRLRGERDKIVLVGSNGGMLHAFHSGTVIRHDPDTQMPIYDAGTGIEQWAFVPPDLLPKLGGNMGRHAYFVDGSAMVRDVWMDANSDGTKQPQEYRTVAVIGEGPGGVHRFALDLTRLIGKSTDPANPIYEVPNEPGDFLWMWPQPCDADALLVGESSGNFAPKPPPIGPVAIADSAGPYEVNGTPAVEKWIVMVNGGYDQWMARGRMLAMLDLETGYPIWSFKYNDGSPNSEHLMFPMASPPALMDLGNANSSAPDGDMLFDTATVVDYGGNIWTVRFWEPGVESTATVLPGAPRQPMINWFAARSFQAYATDPASVRQPFAQMTSNAIQPDTGWLRTFVGTGDRHNLMDYPGNVCRLSNPSACARQGCTVNNTLTIERGGMPALSAQHNFENYLDRGAPITASTAGNACAGARINVSWSYVAANTCAMTETGSIEYVCGGDSTTWSCSNTIDNWIQRRETQTTLPTASPNRFYGVWTYGVDPGRTFNDSTTAIAFDAARFTDNPAETDPARLVVDVTAATADASGGTTGAAGSLTPGWYLRYGPLSERTGSSSTIIDGCVLWNSFEATGGGAVCATSGANMARFFQGQFVSGAPNCARSFFDVPGTPGWSRSVSRSVVAVPGDPTPVRVVYNGVGASTVVTMEAGRNRGDTVSEAKELMQTIYQVEVDRAAHDCRHEGPDPVTGTTQCE